MLKTHPPGWTGLEFNTKTHTHTVVMQFSALTPYTVSANCHSLHFWTGLTQASSLGTRGWRLALWDSEAEDSDLVQGKPLTRCWEEGVIYVVLGQGASGVRAVPLQEAVFFEGTALRGGHKAR